MTAYTRIACLKALVPFTHPRDILSKPICFFSPSFCASQSDPFLSPSASERRSSPSCQKKQPPIRNRFEPQIHADQHGFKAALCAKRFGVRHRRCRFPCTPALAQPAGSKAETPSPHSRAAAPQRAGVTQESRFARCGRAARSAIEP